MKQYMKRNAKFQDPEEGGRIAALARTSTHQALAVWAADCAERVLPLFERDHPDDERPRRAIEAVREWARIGEFRMNAVREISLAAHAAARSAPEGSPARFAARACGQAMATAHVPTHSMAAAWYAAKAVWANGGEANDLRMEREWQFNRLTEISFIPRIENDRSA